MSMSIEQRRTTIVEEATWPAGKARLVKASNRFDRRFRHFAVEWCPSKHVGTDLEEVAYRVLYDWSVRERDAYDRAHLFFMGVSLLLRDMSRDRASA